jgi:hypothetical protein
MTVLPLLLSLTVGATLEVPTVASGFFSTLVSLWCSITCHYTIHLSHPLPCGPFITLHVWEVLWCFWCVSHIHIFDTFILFLFDDWLLTRLNLKSRLVLDAQ